MVVVGVAFEGVLRDTLGHVVGDPDEPGNMFQFQLVLSGIWLVVRGLGSFVYFGLSELLTQGQTVGKRSAKIRVVKRDGFSPDSVSVFMRNIFRVVGQLPPLWFVPVVSTGHQRFGDMVAGTVAVVDEIKQLHSFREVLRARSPADSPFRFDARMLERARPGDTPPNSCWNAGPSFRNRSVRICPCKLFRHWQIICRVNLQPKRTTVVTWKT